MHTHNSTGTCYFCKGALWEMSLLYCKDKFSLCAVTLLTPVGISCSRGDKRHHKKKMGIIYGYRNEKLSLVSVVLSGTSGHV